MPIFTKIVYSFGADAVDAAFYRMSLSLIIMFILNKFIYKESLKLNKLEVKFLLLASLGLLVTSIWLYNSYNYMDSGTATALHFSYPIIIFVAVSLIYKKKPRFIELACVLGVSVSIPMLTMGNANFHPLGIFFSIGSACTFAFYAIILQDQVFMKMPPIVKLFYINAFSSIIIFAFSLVRGKPVLLSLSPMDFLIAFTYSCTITLGATYLYQNAIFLIGAKYTSIVSAIEPVVSSLIGVFILNESIGYVQVFAIFLICLSTIVLVVSSRNYLEE